MLEGKPMKDKRNFAINDEGTHHEARVEINRSFSKKLQYLSEKLLASSIARPGKSDRRFQHNIVKQS